MAETLRLRIVTPDRTLLDEDVLSVRFTGADGSYGILPRHAPLVTATEPGLLTYETPDGKRHDLAVAEGFAEMLGNRLTIIAEAGERADEIDLARARAAVERARTYLARRTEHGIDVDRAEAALRRALARELAAQRAGESIDR